MRVNVDDKALADPRFARLAARVKMNRHEALGRCLPVWNFAYQQRSEIMAIADVDALADCEGFAKALVAAKLADPKRDKVRLRGVRERIGFLLSQDDKRAKANKARQKGHTAATKSGPDHSSKNLPAGTSRGTEPGDGPYSHDQGTSPDHLHGDHQEKRELAVAGAACSSASSPGGWKPPAGGKAEREAQRRIAAGEITIRDADLCWRALELQGVHRKRGADAIAATWIAAQRPEQNEINGHSDADYQEAPWSR